MSETTPSGAHELNASLDRAFIDKAELARQLGVLPAAGSRGERGLVALQRLRARLRSRRR